MKQIRCIKDKDCNLVPIDKIESIYQNWVSAGGSRHDISYDTYEILLKIFEEVKLDDMATDGSKNPVPELKESEDERIRKRILLSLEKDLMATKNSGCNTQDLEQCIIWIKSLGDIDTQWKPNEKQLIALRRVKSAVGGEGELYNPLNQLYEDLIKL